MKNDSEKIKELKCMSERFNLTIRVFDDHVYVFVTPNKRLLVGYGSLIKIDKNKLEKIVGFERKELIKKLSRWEYELSEEPCLSDSLNEIWREISEFKELLETS